LAENSKGGIVNEDRTDAIQGGGRKKDQISLETHDETDEGRHSSR